MDTSEDLPNGRPGSNLEAGDGSEKIASPVPDVNATAPNANVEQEEKEDDAVSIKTTTDELLGEGTETSPREHKLGLDINFPWGWSGSSYDDYDVITVHGIRDDYKTAWIDSKGSWFLKDTLFKHMSVREIDYSYENHEESILYKPDGIRILAGKLIDEYAAVRTKLEETETERPIIWVCHDFGGTIVKEALSIAAHSPGRCGKIFMLTTGLVFMGSPHRFQSQDDLEDQLHKLIQLPGPEIKNKTMLKIKHLARQIDSANLRFLETKLFDRATTFNIFIQDAKASLAAKPADDKSLGADGIDYENEDFSKAITPFSRNSHFVGHSFEAAGRWRWDDFGHMDFVRETISSFFSHIAYAFGATGFPFKVGYCLIPFQKRLLSLTPPTRQLSIPFDPVLPHPPALKWIHEQEPYISFEKAKSGFNYLLLHGDGNPLVNISEVSRFFHAALDFHVVSLETKAAEKSIIYFEFDQNDSRYASLLSMLTYLVNVILIRFWREFEAFPYEEFLFLSETCSWTVEDLYHIYSQFRKVAPGTRDLTVFISCFDQCPPEERKWFIDRILNEQSKSIATYHLIITTSTREGLDLDETPRGKHINLMECPLFSEPNGKIKKEFEAELDNLVAIRPIYEQSRSQIQDLLQGCHNTPHLGHLVLAWLESSLRGSSKQGLAATVKSLLPISAKAVVDVFMSSIEPSIKIKAETAFDWIKHAAEPLSPEALIDALAVHMTDDKEIVLEDLDKEAEMAELIKAFGGIITVENGDVKFSHPTFYQVIRLDQDAEESTVRINSSMAAACLRYFQFENAQKTLTELCSANFEGSSLETPLDIVVTSHQRTTFAEYAVRFWPHHYKASEQFSAKQLVHELFDSKLSRAAWEVPFWLLSNPFTRINRHYTSTLPVFAMLGLEDLLDEKMNSEMSHPWFNDNCWLSITEAIRSGEKSIAKKLLDQVDVNEDELQTSLFWAAAQDDRETLDALISKIPDLKTFPWPETFMHRLTSTGQDTLLATVLASGSDVNNTGPYWGCPPTLIAAWRNRVSTLDLILRSEPKPDLTIEDNTGDNLLIAAVRLGNPEMVKLIVDAGADLKNGRKAHDLVRAAVRSGSHEVVGILLEAGAKVEMDAEDEQSPLSLAAANGLLECVRVLLDHKADPNANSSAGTALYAAVEKEHLDIVRFLLEHDPKPSMDIAPLYKDSLFIRAICTENIDLVSLLIKHGAKIDYVDPLDAFNKSPLSRAVREGNLDMVKLLVENGADVNYSEDGTDPPMFASLYYKQNDIAKYLLQIDGVDLTWKGPEGMGTLHGAFNSPELLPDLLKRDPPMNGMSVWGTELHMAARDDELESVEILLKNEPKPDLEATMGDDASNTFEVGYTPLQVACHHFAFRSVKALLEAGANPHVLTNDKEDLVDIVLGREVKSDNVEKILKLLISEPYNLPTERVNDQNRTRLHYINETTTLAVFRIFTESKPNLDARDNKGYTPLAVAISKSNKSIAKNLIEQGATVNIFSPNYGSILHLATSAGSVDLVKLLLGSGADPDLVDLEYGESLLYTALGIEDETKLKKMIRYLVDEAKVPIDKLGGKLGYPIIRATDRASGYGLYDTGRKLVEFLIRRNIRLDVSDNQGRRAVHFACKSPFTDILKALVSAGADIHSADKFGRKPIHFAASDPYVRCLVYLLETLGKTDVDVKDHDQWTSLMWAARSGDFNSVETLLERGADIWARSRSSEQRTQWSPLKLANFAGRSQWITDLLVPKELSRTKGDGSQEEWDEYFHKSKVGDDKRVICDSCLVLISGLRWDCIECNDSFSLCFKCVPHKSDLHNPEHSFRDIGPLYETESVVSSVRSDSSQELAPAKEEDENSESSAGIDLQNLELDLED
ncbi:ankyrin repeat-containing domain protein [Fusarium oxysporum]|nr:ankyrin repeat-containing domain protein [Fusarium oxysporum]